MARKIGTIVKLFRLVKKRHKAKKRAKAVQTRKIVAAQKIVAKNSRTTAGELKAQHGYEWEGDGLPDSTVVEPVMGPNGWEYVPVQTRRTGTKKTAASATKCGAPTKDGKTCQRLGDCPIPAHRRHRK